MDVSSIKKELTAWIPMIDGVDVHCRHLRQSDSEALRQEAMDVSYDPRSGKKTETLDELKFAKLLARKVVVNWRGITDGNKDWPCNDKNIDYMMAECIEFRSLVTSAPLSLQQMIAAEAAATEKNSPTTSLPASTTPA